MKEMTDVDMRKEIIEHLFCLSLIKDGFWRDDAY
jgi:hypothetical protein